MKQTNTSKKRACNRNIKVINARYAESIISGTERNIDMELSIKEAVDLSIDRGDYPDVIPVDYGNDLTLKTEPGIIVRIMNPRKVKISISTFGYTHYYADITADGVSLIEETERGEVRHCGYICE